MADTRQQPPSRFSQEEAADIIREATSRSLRGKDEERPLTREDLLSMAQEMGISESAVEGVLAARLRKKQGRRRRHLALMGLASHGLSYAIVIAGLTLLDLLTGPRWWVQWPAIGWGMGLAFHAMGVLLSLMPRPGAEDRDGR
ncbi:2TM domain-containing protein [Pyxidicoccus sp. 3LG]